jgi:hypothetical protein
MQYFAQLSQGCSLRLCSLLLSCCQRSPSEPTRPGHRLLRGIMMQRFLVFVQFDAHSNCLMICVAITL